MANKLDAKGTGNIYEAEVRSVLDPSGLVCVNTTTHEPHFCSETTSRIRS